MLVNSSEHIVILFLPKKIFSKTILCQWFAFIWSAFGAEPKNPVHFGFGGCRTQNVERRRFLSFLGFHVGWSPSILLLYLPKSRETRDGERELGATERRRH